MAQVAGKSEVGAKALMAAILAAHHRQTTMQGATAASKVTANGNGEAQKSPAQMPNKIEVTHKFAKDDGDTEDNSAEGTLKKITDIISSIKKTGK